MEEEERERKIARCIKCRAEFSISELSGAKCCPGCGDKGQPLAIDDDVVIRINWHELRLICSWAEKWCEYAAGSARDNSQDLRGIIEAIIKSLECQYPGFESLNLEIETVCQLPAASKYN